MNHAYSRENFQKRQVNKVDISDLHFSDPKVDDRGEYIKFKIKKNEYLLCRVCNQVHEDLPECPNESKN